MGIKKSRLMQRRGKKAAPIELNWDPQTNRDNSREQNRMSDKVLRDVGTYVSQVKDKIVQNGLSLGQALSGKTLKDVMNSQDYNVRALGNKLKSMVNSYIQNSLDPKEKAYFQENYGNNITDILNKVQIKTSSKSRFMEARAKKAIINVGDPSWMGKGPDDNYEDNISDDVDSYNEEITLYAEDGTEYQATIVKCRVESDKQYIKSEDDYDVTVLEVEVWVTLSAQAAEKLTDSELKANEECVIVWMDDEHIDQPENELIIHWDKP